MRAVIVSLLWAAALAVGDTNAPQWRIANVYVDQPYVRATVHVTLVGTPEGAAPSFWWTRCDNPSTRTLTPDFHPSPQGKPAGAEGTPPRYEVRLPSSPGSYLLICLIGQEARAWSSVVTVCEWPTPPAQPSAPPTDAAKPYSDTGLAEAFAAMVMESGATTTEMVGPGGSAPQPTAAPTPAQKPPTGAATYAAVPKLAPVRTPTYVDGHVKWDRVVPQPTPALTPTGLQWWLRGQAEPRPGQMVSIVITATSEKKVGSGTLQSRYSVPAQVDADGFFAVLLPQLEEGQLYRIEISREDSDAPFVVDGVTPEKGKNLPITLPELRRPSQK